MVSHLEWLRTLRRRVESISPTDDGQAYGKFLTSAQEARLDGHFSASTTLGVLLKIAKSRPHINSWINDFQLWQQELDIVFPDTFTVIVLEQKKNRDDYKWDDGACLRDNHECDCQTLHRADCSKLEIDCDCHECTHNTTRSSFQSLPEGCIDVIVVNNRMDVSPNMDNYTQRLSGAPIRLDADWSGQMFPNDEYHPSHGKEIDPEFLERVYRVEEYEIYNSEYDVDFSEYFNHEEARFLLVTPYESDQ